MCCGDALFRIGRWLFVLSLYHDPDLLTRSARALLGMDYDWLLPTHLSPVRQPLPPAARVSAGGGAPPVARLIEWATGFRYMATIGRA